MGIFFKNIFVIQDFDKPIMDNRNNRSHTYSHLAFTYLKSSMETQEQCVISVQS